MNQHNIQKLTHLKSFDGRFDMPRLITLREVMHVTGLARSTIYKKIKDSNFPPPLKISTGCVRWKEIDITNWILSLKTNTEFP